MLFRRLKSYADSASFGSKAAGLNLPEIYPPHYSLNEKTA